MLQKWTTPKSPRIKCISLESQWGSLLYIVMQGPRLMATLLLHHLELMDLSIVWQKERMLKALPLAMKFFDSEVKHILSTHSLLARTSHMVCLTANGQGSISLLGALKKRRIGHGWAPKVCILLCYFSTIGWFSEVELNEMTVVFKFK